VYWGIGLGSIIQIQFGREKLANTKLFRIRTDFPLYVFDVDEESILNTMSAGLFYDHAFNNPKRASTIGISIGFSMVSLLMSED
jgi:hypothetical protein